MLSRGRVAIAVALLAAACSADDGESRATTLPPYVPTTASEAMDQLYPDVIAASAHQEGDAYRFEVTMSSPYDTPERYADAWRIVGPDGDVYGVRELLHDHAGEQPFTRSLSGVLIPADVTTVVVEGRDKDNGWGGKTMSVEVPPLASGS